MKANFNNCYLKFKSYYPSQNGINAIEEIEFGNFYMRIEICPFS